MRALLCALSLIGFLTFSVALPGCIGQHEGGMEEYDPELSKKKAAEYEQQMKAAREKAMKQAQQQRGRGGPPGRRP